jgi:hypothetical protein
VRFHRPKAKRLGLTERDKQLWARFHITEIEWAAILELQGGVCAVCGTPSPSKKGWCLDHDHDCCGEDKACFRCIRGLLCTRCNVGLGYVEGWMREGMLVPKGVLAAYLARRPIIVIRNWDRE